MPRTTTASSTNIMKDLGIIAMSAMIAVILVKTDVLVKILTSSLELERFGSFIAGMFFTSVFTAAPSIVTLGEIAQAQPVLLTAFFGALGAIVGDLIIFRFVKDRLSQHLMEMVEHKRGSTRVKLLMKTQYFRWITFFLGGLIIASPLPDEIGISLMGFSKMKTALFIPLSFAFNFIGIWIIGTVARSVQ